MELDFGLVKTQPTASGECFFANCMSMNLNQLAVILTTRCVRLSARHAWPVIVAFLITAVLCGIYFARHFAITTDSNKLLSS